MKPDAAIRTDEDELPPVDSRAAMEGPAATLRPALRQTFNMDALPYAAHDLIEVIGLQATIDLVSAFGGGELRVPARRDNSRVWSELADAVGDLAAGQLVDSRYGGTPVYVPMCTSALRAERNRQIVALIRQGEGIERVRRKFRLTRSAVYRIFRTCNAS